MLQAQDAQAQRTINYELHPTRIGSGGDADADYRA